MRFFIFVSYILKTRCLGYYVIEGLEFSKVYMNFKKSSVVEHLRDTIIIFLEERENAVAQFF